MSFAPIRVSVLRGDQKIGFDVFVEVAGKHILYLRKGDSFEGQRLDRLKKKKLKKMYIRDEDEQLYRDYMSRNIEMAYDQKSGQSIEDRSHIVQGIQQSAAESMFENPQDEATYKEVKAGTERFTQFLLNEENALRSLLAIDNGDQNLAHHGVTVASMAVEIARLTGFTDTHNLSLVALGALIHDLGHHISGQNIARPLKDFSAEELKIYHEHPAVGASKLREVKHIDLQVAQIILEHEETIDGSGFPGKLTESKVNPLSVYVQSANLFDRMMTFEGIPRPDIVRRLMTDAIGRYPLEHLNAIKTILQR